MRLLPTDEQRAISSTVREACAKHCPPEVLRNGLDDAGERRLWTALAELGVFGLTVSENYGGLGLHQPDAALALQELGWAGVPGPVAETFAVSQILQQVQERTVAEHWLPQIAAGSAVASLGLDQAPLVESADRADLLVLAHDDGLHALPAADVQLTRQQSIDLNRRLFTVEWEPSAETRLSPAGSRPDLAATARDHLLLATSAQLIGLAKRLLEFAIQHVRMREQFGRPLGMFQAVQHRLADVAVGIEFAETVVARAACSLAGDEPSIVRDVAMAKVFASDAAERAAYSGLQVHGAIGYTQEHDFHLYALRAWVLATAHGDARRHRQRVADELLGCDSAARFPAA